MKMYIWTAERGTILYHCEICIQFLRSVFEITIFEVDTFCTKSKLEAKQRDVIACCVC